LTTKALSVFKQLREDDQPYLASMQRKTEFTRHIEEFLDEVDEAQGPSFPFQKRIYAAAKTHFLDEKQEKLQSNIGPLAAGIRLQEAKNTSTNKTANAKKDIDELSLEDSSDGESVSASSGSSDVDWKDL
jgi:hypothetical protein